MTLAFQAAFREWQRRYNADPQGFATDWPQNAEYGVDAAEYFEKLLNELAAGRPWDQIGADGKVSA